jgi:uncharacterized protein (TIGR03437 family)
MKRWVILLTVGAAALNAQTPVLPAGGVVNGASFIAAGQPSGAVAPGAIIAVFGQELSSTTAVALSVPLSNSLNNTSITFGTTQAPLFFVSALQINAQLPYDTPTGTVNVRVTRGTANSQTQTVQVAQFSPGIFSLRQDGTGPGAILIANSATFAQPAGSILQRESRPAARGEFITIFCTGLGALDNPVPSGAAAPASPLSRATTLPEVRIGGIAGNVVFAGLAPMFVGLYQINVQVPQGVTPGNEVTVQIIQGGVQGNTTTIAVQ